MLDKAKVRALVRLVSIGELARDLGVLQNLREREGHRTGRRWEGRCPFCRAEHEAKFVIYDNSGVRDARGAPAKAGWYRCYRGSCGAHGDALELVRRLGDLNYGASVAKLAALVGVELRLLQQAGLSPPPRRRRGRRPARSEG